MGSDNHSNYSIDDILEEARRKKAQRQNQPSARPPLNERLDSARTKESTPLKDTDAVAVPAKILVEKGTLPPFPTPNPLAASKKEQLANAELKTIRKSDLPQPPLQEADFRPPEVSPVQKKPPLVPLHVMKPEADDVKVYIPKTAPKPPEMSETPSGAIYSGKNMARSNPPKETVPPHISESADDLEQIQMDSLLKSMPEDSPLREHPNGNLEERLKIERAKKAENFRLRLPSTFKLAGEEEENEPGEEPEVFEDEEIEDYNSYEDTETVKSELVYRRRTGFIRLVMTAAIALALVAAALEYYILDVVSINSWLYLGGNAFLLALAALINHQIMGEGLGALFHMRANAESLAGVSAVLAVLQTLIQFFNIDAVTYGSAIILAPVAAMGLFLAAWGKQMLLRRINKNFQFVSFHGEKYAANLVDDERTAAEIGRAAVDVGDPVVCYFEKTNFLTHFLEYSYDKDARDPVMRIYAPCVACASAALAVIYGLAGGGTFSDAFTAFVSAVCLAAAFGTITVSESALLNAARHTLRYGSMLIGWRAAEEFGEIHALAVDALELFPSESVLLHGIKTFSGTRIDEAILDAAAVSIAAGGPLSSVFRRVIQNRTDILKDVDTLVYEQDMGMSGWVGGRRVLIGNRHLLENHGVDVPSRDYEARYAKDGRQLVYLSTAGELSAMFVISYVADEGITDALSAMSGAGITLLVRTCDPNVTEELICRVFGLDAYYVEVMGAPAGRCYEKLTCRISREHEAVMASNGRLEGMAYGVTHCYRLLSGTRLAVMIQVIGGALGFALYAFLSLYLGIFLKPLPIIAYSLILTVFSWIVTWFKRM